MIALADIGELRGKNALLKFACGCLALSEGYRDRAPFNHRRHDVHTVDACAHAQCTMAHTCGASGPDRQHRGPCGPRPPALRPAVPTAPAPTAPGPQRTAPTPTPTPAVDSGEWVFPESLAVAR